MVSASFIALLAGLSAPPSVMQRAVGCADILVRSVQHEIRPVSPDDLARLRDIGGEVEWPNAPLFSVSPDGSRIALQLRRADPDNDRYCLAMVIIDLRAHAAPVIVDIGGTPIKQLYPDLAGRADVASGQFRAVTPTWAPDGTAIYFLKQTGATVQVWRAASDGSGSQPISPETSDVAEFVLVRAGRTLIYTDRTGRAAAQRQLEAEGASGFRFDRRFWPFSSNRPFPAAPLALTYVAIDLGDARTRLAKPEERAELDRQRLDASAERTADLWRQVDDAAGFPPTTRLVSREPGNRLVACAAAACANPEPYFWRNDRATVIFSRRQGWSQDTTVFYRWTPGTGGLTQMFASQDRFLSCQPAGTRVVCAHESAIGPRRIVLLDLASGTMTPVFDPNPDFTKLRRGAVRRLRWLSEGVERYADLVYPVGYRAGLRYPLIIVQYISRGFLRGGVGDEYPVQAFSGRGYFVLSVQNPVYGAGAPTARTDVDVERDDLKNFRARREKLAAIETVIRMLIDSGKVDRNRVGITGLSEGSSTVQFAGLNSNVFAAAAMSTCCWEPGQDALLGPNGAEKYHSIGWPRLVDTAPEFWARLSWERNAAKVAFPVLMQLSDSELTPALASYTALTQRQHPVALYVFPDEDHVKSHPSHRLAVYARNLAWFDFWLRREASTRPEDLRFTDDWRALRAKLPASDYAGSH